VLEDENEGRSPVTQNRNLSLRAERSSRGGAFARREHACMHPIDGVPSCVVCVCLCFVGTETGAAHGAVCKDRSRVPLLDAAARRRFVFVCTCVCRGRTQAGAAWACGFESNRCWGSGGAAEGSPARALAGAFDRMMRVGCAFVEGKHLPK